MSNRTQRLARRVVKCRELKDRGATKGERDAACAIMAELVLQLANSVIADLEV